mgnify:CR=1 FL=1
MDILRSDRDEGYVKIDIESRDDLWYLKDIIKGGERLRKRTRRTKLDGREKKSCILTVEAEKTEYQEDRLRVTGEIKKGDEDVEMGYHTFNLEEGDEVEIRKEFTEGEWEKLQEAESHRQYQVLFCLVEKGGVDFYVVRETGIEDLSSIEVNIPGKLYSDQESGEDFYSQVQEYIQRAASEFDYIVLAGPGHEKNKVKNSLSEGILEKVFMQDTSVTGKTGLNEAIKRGALEKVVEDSRISEETRIFREFTEKLRGGEEAAYGAEKVYELAEQGAVEKLLVTSEMNRERPEIAEKVEQMGGESKVMHTDHEAGERLEELGGIAAILRY